jgi:hypothetical protein
VQSVQESLIAIETVMEMGMFVLLGTQKLSSSLATAPAFASHKMSAKYLQLLPTSRASHQAVHCSHCSDG